MRCRVVTLTGLLLAASLWAQPTTPRPGQIAKEQTLPWEALSGLSADGAHPGYLFTAPDKIAQPAQLLRLDTTTTPFRMTDSWTLTKLGRLDIEGVAWSQGGRIWLVGEGSKKHPNRLVSYNPSTEEVDEVTLPDEVHEKVAKHGLEGIAVLDGKVFVGFQKGWQDDPEDSTRLGCYDPQTETWQFALYPLGPELFLSGLTHAPNGRLAILERDKLAGERAVHKRIYTVDVSNFSSPLKKDLLVDLIPVYKKEGITVPEKIEGLAFDGHDLWVVNDDDGGQTETTLLKVNSTYFAK